MKNLEKLTERGFEIVKECCGADVINSNIRRPFQINWRAKTRWGQCSLVCGRYTIEISHRILRDDVPDNAALGTIVHEILHACKGGHSHTGMWKIYANQVNAKYPELAISRCTSADKFGLEEEQREIRRRYAIRCVECGVTHYSSKKSKSIQHPDWYRCKCGGELERIQ